MHIPQISAKFSFAALSASLHLWSPWKQSPVTTSPTAGTRRWHAFFFLPSQFASTLGWTGKSGLELPPPWV